MKIFPEIEMATTTMPGTGSPALVVQSKVRAERQGVMYEEVFQAVYPVPDTPREYADVMGHFMLECYGWQQCHIFTTEQIAEDQTKEDARVWDIFKYNFKHQRE